MGRKNGMGAMGVLVAVMLGIVFVIAIYSIVPGVGYTIDTAAPVGDAHVMGDVAHSGGYNFSVWNTSANQALYNASEVWAGVSGLPVAAVIAIVIAVAVGGFLLLGRY